MTAVGYGPGDAKMVVPRRYAGMSVHRERSGDRGSWNTALHTPEPNTVYVVDERVLYVTDDQGRVEHVEGWLGYEERSVEVARRSRNSYRQGRAGGSWRLEIDDGGHLVATKLKGPGEAINIVAMARRLNRAGQDNWWSMERTWIDLRRRGEQVHARIDIEYTGESERPSLFGIVHRHGGTTHFEEFEQ